MFLCLNKGNFRTPLQIGFLCHGSRHKLLSLCVSTKSQTGRSEKVQCLKNIVVSFRTLIEEKVGVLSCCDVAIIPMGLWAIFGMV